MRVTITFNNRDFGEGLRALSAKFPVAIRRALSRAATSGKAAMAKEITADTGLSSKRIKDEIKTVFVGASAVQLVITGARIPLIDFRASGPEPSRGKGRGVSYRLPGGRGRVPRAFIATMPGGHRGVFQRAGTPRLPIREVYGPSLVHVFEKFLPLGAQRAEEALVKNIKSEIAFALSRR